MSNRDHAEMAKAIKDMLRLAEQMRKEIDGLTEDQAARILADLDDQDKARTEMHALIADVEKGRP